MLYKKLIRDFWNHKGAYLASMVLVMVGILVYNMMSMMHDSFDYSLDLYYDAYNIASGTLKVTNMPLSKVEEMIKIEDVKYASGRIEKRVRLLDEDREVMFNFISYDASDPNRLNDVELMGGRMPNPGKPEIVMGNLYFKAMNLSLNDDIAVIINGEKQVLKIVGYGRSPEFIYAKKNDNELISDPKSFDTVFMPYNAMSDMFLMKNQVNNVAFTLYESSNFEIVKLDIKDFAYKYGLLELTELEDQVSHMTTKQKLDGIGSMTTSIPIMFLLISGAIIYIVLKRIIEKERTQIGVLKACGVTDFRILIHYIIYALIVGTVGGSLGAYIGISSVPSLIELMGVSFNMPFVTTGLSQRYIIYSFMLSMFFAISSGYMGARKCLKLEPADAMRPPVSKESTEGLMDKFYWIFEEADMKLRLALRNMMRNKGRSLFILFGVAITAALLTFPVSMADMYSKMLFDQFSKVEVYDMKVSLNTFMDQKTIVNIISNKPGIDKVEPQMILPVEIKNNWKKAESAIICMNPDGELYNLYDMDDNPVNLTQDGLTLSHWLAKKLDVEVGDEIVLESPLFRGESIRKIRVAQIVPQYVGTNGYMNIELIPELLEGKNYVNAVMVTGSEAALKNLNTDLKDSKFIATFDYREQISAVFESYMSQTTSVIFILIVVGMLIGFSVIYVSLTISMSERNRELATMLVVGLTESEVHQVLLIEQFFLAIVGIAAGIPMGKGLLVSFAETSSTDFLVMPSVIPNDALLFSVITTVIAILIPQIIGRKNIGKIVVSEALNARE